MTENEVSRHVVDAAYRLHRQLGPGLFESVYEVALAKALQSRGLSVKRQVVFPVSIEDAFIDRGFRVDLVVEDCVLVEIKSLDRIAMAHRKQLLTYLRLANKRLGLLVNFGAGRIKDGIVRIVNGLPD